MPGGVPGDSEHPDGTSGREGPPPKTLTPALSRPLPPPHTGRGGTPGAFLFCSLFSRLGGGRWAKRVGVMRGLAVSPSSPGVGDWEGAGEEGRGDEGLGRGKL
jgi:hypothetical protein